MDERKRDEDAKKIKREWFIEWEADLDAKEAEWIERDKNLDVRERESEGMINQQSADLDAKERESEYVINWDTDRPACERKRERER